MEKALKKTITYRVIVSIGALAITGITWIITGNIILTIGGGWVFGELYRSGVYYIHEKIYGD